MFLDNCSIGYASGGSDEDVMCGTFASGDIDIEDTLRENLYGPVTNLKNYVITVLPID